MSSDDQSVGRHHLSLLPLKAMSVQFFMPSGQSLMVVHVCEHMGAPEPAMHTPLSQSFSFVHGSPAWPLPRGPGTQQGTGTLSVPAFSQRRSGAHSLLAKQSFVASSLQLDTGPTSATTSGPTSGIASSMTSEVTSGELSGKGESDGASAAASESGETSLPASLGLVPPVPA